MSENQPVGGQSKISRQCTVQEAASLLGVSVETVRARIKRGTLAAQRTDEGIFVWLQVIPDKDQATTSREQTATPHQPAEEQSNDQSELAPPLTEQIAYFREQRDHER